MSFWLLFEVSRDDAERTRFHVTVVLSRSYLVTFGIGLRFWHFIIQASAVL